MSTTIRHLHNITHMPCAQPNAQNHTHAIPITCMNDTYLSHAQHNTQQTSAQPKIHSRQHKHMSTQTQKCTTFHRQHFDISFHSGLGIYEPIVSLVFFVAFPVQCKEYSFSQFLHSELIISFVIAWV